MRRRHLILHFTGASVAKLAPPLVQFVLLLLVARDGSLDDVGRLALASAVAFLCGALAEIGLGTSLSIPRVAFGTEDPPLHGTRRLRLSAAALGSVLYVVLWAAGLGGHDPAFLLVAPLPFFLALALGYAGAMNASGRLRYEIPISLGESGLILAVALLGSLAVPALTASLVALSVGRGVGLVARMVVVSRLPQSRAERVDRPVRAQLPFALATVGWVVQGQMDMVVLGFVGALATVAVYGPLMRTAYSTLLSAEALSWALFGGANPEEHERPGRLARRWRELGIGLGVGAAIVFVLLAEPFLHFLLNRTLPNLTPAVLLFGVVIVARFAALTLHVDIVRAGRQRDEVPVLLVSALVLGVAGGVAAGANSLTGLAAARLGSELLIAAGFLVIRRRGSTHRERIPERPGPTGRPRLLVLAPFPPRLDAAHGGARVIAQLVAHLGERIPIALLCLRHPSERPADDELRARVARFEEVARPRVASPGARALRFARWRLAALLRGRPFWASDLRVRAYRERIEATVREFDPDIVQFEYTVMAQYLPALGSSGARRVIVEYDPEAGAAGAEGSVTRRLDARAWGRFRRRALNAADAAVVFTERDRADVARVAADTPLVRIPFGTDPAPLARPAESDGSVLFVGNFVHAPNVEAARRLVTSIFPRVRQSHPSAVLHIVGDQPPSDLAPDAPPGVIVTGWVADLAPYLERAAVVVAPLRSGGGMRVKVSDALAAGKAVVTSPLGAEGLDVVDGQQLRMAVDDEDFAARICELLDDAGAREELAGRGAAWARENLSWPAALDAYEHLYEQLLRGSQPSQASHAGPSPGARNQTRAIHSP